jgi:hypothetical protein
MAIVRRIVASMGRTQCCGAAAAEDSIRRIFFGTIWAFQSEERATSDAVLAVFVII